MKKTNVVIFLKGTAIGASMLVPGLSGGTMAIILGIYDDMIHAVSSFFQDKRKNALFLLRVGLGGLLGMCLFARLLLRAVTAFPMPMLFLFLGAILGSIPVLFKKSGAGKFRPVQLVYFGTGAAIVLGMSCLPETGLDFAAAGGFGFFLLFLAGLLVSVALVLPGISASYMLLLLGLYEITLSAIDRMELLFLSPLILGVLVGILLTTRLLETAMQRFPTASYLMIAGFVAGSVTEVFPGFPSGIHIFICAVTLLAGFFSTLLLSRLIRRTGTSLHTAYTGRN